MTPLTERGKQIRRDTLTLGLPNFIYHYGGSFSVVEILIALYDKVFSDGPPHVGPDDAVIMSKGHCWIPQVVILRERGLDPGWGPRLDTGAPCLVGHPFRDPLNGIPATTGSLGHGMPVGMGMALAKKMQKQPGRVFVIVGDGECQEGTFWESLLLARKFGLKNLCVIVDSNSAQGSGSLEQVYPRMPNLTAVAELAGWETAGVDGHDPLRIARAIQFGMLDSNGHDHRPVLIVAETIKGRGVSFMENDPSWHARYPTKEEQAKAFAELAPAMEEANV